MRDYTLARLSDSSLLRDLAALVALVGVSIPATDVCKSGLQSNVGLDQLCDLPERVTVS